MQMQALEIIESRCHDMRRSRGLARVLLFMILPLLVLGFGLTPAPSRVSAHGGGLDSDGGHNCYVGSCAGTYHCHRAWGPGCGGGYQPSSPSTNQQSSRSSSTPSRPRVAVAQCVRLSGVTEFTKGEIALIQAMLQFLGFNPGPIDGVYGPRTRAALNSFESRIGYVQSAGNLLYYSSIQALLVGCST
jgi:hypothetical protein